MAWRTVSISQPAKLSLNNNSLKITQDETHILPLEDLNAVILNHPQIIMTAPLLGKMAEHNVAVFSIDEKSIPNGVFTSFHPHSRQTKTVKEQITWGRAFKKRMQQRIISNKIQNQSSILESIGLSSVSAEIKEIASQVKSGDKGNLESQASMKYFRSLLSNFTRRQDNLHNAALNYGYTIIRGITARAVVGQGFIPCLGLFHDNELNAFNLADDIMEPYRPIVDHLVIKILGRNTENIGDDFTPNLKKQITEVIFCPCIIGESEYTLHHSLDILLRGLSTASNTKQAKDYPEVVLKLF